MMKYYKMAYNKIPTFGGNEVVAKTEVYIRQSEVESHRLAKSHSLEEVAQYLAECWLADNEPCDGYCWKLAECAIIEA